MEALNILPTDNTPAIELLPRQARLSIRGESYPENVAAFYEPLLEALSEYLQSAQSLRVDFAMVYFNTSSAKFFYDLFLLLEKVADRVEIEIVWFYRADDEIMLEHGEDFQLDFNLPIRLETLPPVEQS